VLASCAGELSRLALAIKFYQGHGWPDINTGLGVLAADAVREATVRVKAPVLQCLGKFMTRVVEQELCASSWFSSTYLQLLI